MIAGRTTGIVFGAFALAAILFGAATASANQSENPNPNPDPEDCDDLNDQLAALTSKRSDLQNQRAWLVAAANAAAQQGGGSDEEILVQIAEIDGQIAATNAQIAATNAQLEACG